jgi:hypothetical protein
MTAFSPSMNRLPRKNDRSLDRQARTIEFCHEVQGQERSIEQHPSGVLGNEQGPRQERIEQLNPSEADRQHPTGTRKAIRS